MPGLVVVRDQLTPRSPTHAHRETQSLSERKTVDRPLANKLHDKLWMTGRLGFIKQV